VLRRSRGAVPAPLILPVVAPKHILAVGGELKNAFCLVRENMYFVSHHIGDLENVQTLAAFEDGVAHLKKLLYVEPEVVVYDRHPDYLATKWALALDGVEKIGIQHHHAQVLSCVADSLPDDPSLLEGKVTGVAFDGLGYGDDGHIWGGEFLVFDAIESRRAGHLDAVFGARMMSLGIPFTDTLDPVEGEVLVQMMAKGVNAPPTSSMGRLFDAVSAIAGVRRAVNYEGQAAIELEYYTNASVDGAYPFEIEGRDDGMLIVSPAPMFEALVADVRRGEPVPVLSTRFHNGVAEMLVEVCRRIRGAEGLSIVALSGGVWQNRYLLTCAVALLEAAGFRVLTHSRVPANDGGLALGQALHGAAVLANRG
jgi:hydrogenase maturation protein HypF